MTVQTTTSPRRRLPRASRSQRPRRRHRDHPRQGHRHRRLRPGLAGRHRAAHHRRPHRDRQRRHLPALRRGHQPARPLREGRQGPRRVHRRHAGERRRPRRSGGAVKGAKKALTGRRRRRRRRRVAAVRRSRRAARADRGCADGSAGPSAPSSATRATTCTAWSRRARTLPVDLRGIDDAAVRARRARRPVAAVVSTIALDRPPGRRAELLAHSRVVDALAAAGAVRPGAVRVGAARRRESVVEDLLAPDEDRFVELLGRPRGRVAVQPACHLRRGAGAGRGRADRPGDRRAARAHPRPARGGRAPRPGAARRAGRARRWSDKRDEDAHDALLDVVLPLDARRARPRGVGLDHVLDAGAPGRRRPAAELEERLEDLAEAVHERIRLRLDRPGGARTTSWETAAWA